MLKPRRRRSSFFKQIDEEAAEAMRRYQYRGEDRSYLYRYVLTPMNAFLIDFVPRWMAPNLITTIGLLFTVAGCAFTAIYSPSFDRPLPGWLYAACAFCLFAYQTIDNLDGRQARRTGSSSPLGLLFDHGVDAVNCSIGTMLVAACYEVGSGPKLLLVWLMVISLFALATWEEYYTGQLILPPVNGPSDGQMISVVTLLLAALYPGLWGWQIKETVLAAVFRGTPAMEWQMSSLPLLVAAISFVPTALSNCWAVSKHTSLLHALPTLLPFIMLITFASTWMAYSPSGVFAAHPRVFLLSFGVLFAGLACRLMLAHICHKPYPYLQPILGPAAVLSSNAIWPSFAPGVRRWFFISEPTALYLCAAINFIVFALFVTQVVNEITTLLGIRCFHISQIGANKKEVPLVSSTSTVSPSTSPFPPEGGGVLKRTPMSSAFGR